MTNEEKIKNWKLYEKAVKAYPDDWCKTTNICPSDIVHSARIGYLTGALEMSDWKNHNPSDETIRKIAKLCDKFDKTAPWNSVSWCEHAEDDDWDQAYASRITYIKSHLKDK